MKATFSSFVTICGCCSCLGSSTPSFGYVGEAASGDKKGIATFQAGEGVEIWREAGVRRWRDLDWVKERRSKWGRLTVKPWRVLERETENSRERK